MGRTVAAVDLRCAPLAHRRRSTPPGSPIHSPLLFSRSEHHAVNIYDKLTPRESEFVKSDPVGAGRFHGPGVDVTGADRGNSPTESEVVVAPGS